MFKKSESEIDDQPKFADLLSNGRGLLTLTLIVAIGSHAINIFAVRTVLPHDRGRYWRRQNPILVNRPVLAHGHLGRHAHHQHQISHRRSAKFLSRCHPVGHRLRLWWICAIFEVIIIGRGIQGFAEGILVSLAYMVLADTYKGVI